jgi:hypothetical protein
MSPRFTPSLLSGEKLEQLFVNREDLAAAAVDRVSDAASHGRLAHTLYVGPRGSGKTHLIAIICYRIKQLLGFGADFSIAWLPEDPWGITSFPALMEAIAANSEPHLGKDETSPPLTVVLSENFDWILRSLGLEGQRQLRAHIERHENLLLVTSATRLTDHIVQQAQPFYGFFDVIELKPFTLDEAIVMLQRKAQLENDVTLVRRLGEPDTRARLAAIKQMAGDQPRVWAIFATGLKNERLKDMLDLMIESFDELTPYYQEQLARLSPNELKAILALIDADGAMTVSEIAQKADIGERSLASTLRDLRRAHWVVPRSGYLTQFLDKRLTYYQLAEPLARVALQIKASRGKPIRFAVDFLTAWYSKEELASTLSLPSLEPSIMCYVKEAAEMSGSHWNRIRDGFVRNAPSFGRTLADPIKPDVAVLDQCAQLDAALATLQHKQTSAALMALPVGIVNFVETHLEKVSVGLFRIELALLALRSLGQEEWLARALDAAEALDVGEEKTAQLSLACIRLLLGQADAGLATLDDALALGDSELTMEQWGLIANTVMFPYRLMSQSTRIDILAKTASHISDEDLPDLIAVSLHSIEPARARDRLINSLASRMTHEAVREVSSIDAFLAIVRDYEMPNDTQWFLARAEIARWRAYMKDAHTASDELQALLLEALELVEPDSVILLEIKAALADARFNIGRRREALAEHHSLLEDYIRMFGPDHPKTLTIRHNIACLFDRMGDVQEGLAEFYGVLADRIRVLGFDHPSTLVTRYNCAHHLAWTEDVQEGLAEFYRVLGDCIRMCGPDASLVLETRHSIADWLSVTGDEQGALAEYRNLLEDSIRVLGPEHPDTLATRHSIAYWLAQDKKRKDKHPVDDS